MKMNARFGTVGADRMPSLKGAKSVGRKQMGLLSQIRNAISKYVSFEEDAIFKDPDWPHLWEHKRER